MLDKRKSSFFVIAAFVALVAAVNGQGSLRVADVDPKNIATQEGQSVNILCRFSKPVIACRFNIPGEPLDIKLNPNWPNQPENFRYFGSGLDNGQCGITILNVQERHHGNATCTLDPNDGMADAVGSIDIVIAKPPHPPQIKLENSEQLRAGDPIEPECSSVDGRPAANITWYLNDQPLGSGQSEVFDSSNDGTTYYTVHSRLRHTLRPEDNNQKLTCRAYHPGYPDGFLDTKLQLSINYRPVAMPEIVVSSLEIGSTAHIGPVMIQANPRPTIKWLVDGKVIDQGQQTDRFVASEPVQSGVAMWNVTLTVTELTLQDTTRSFKLRASNAFGTTDYTIRIGGSQDAASSGLSVVAIIAISIIALFVLVLVALIVVAKVTKRWCFAGDSMHPNGPDSEAQIAPEDDKNHEHYEQHEKVTDSEPEPEKGEGDGVKATNGKAKGNTSV